jgi:hypothetical protein
MKRVILLMAVLALLLGGVGQARAGFIITFSQDGANVDATGTGSINTTDLTNQGPKAAHEPGVVPSIAEVKLGPPPALDGSFYSGITGPSSSIGPSSNFFQASTGAGDVVVLSGASPVAGILINGGTTSGSTISLNSSITWDNTTISQLGLTPGTYKWTWGTGANADFIEVDIPSSGVPEPSSLTLLGLGSLGLLGYGWRRRKQAVA